MDRAALTEAELTQIRYSIIQEHATDAERELAKMLQFLVFNGTDSEEKALPSKDSIAPLYLWLAYRMLGTHNRMFMEALSSTMAMRIAEIKQELDPQ